MRSGAQERSDFPPSGLMLVVAAIDPKPTAAATNEKLAPIAREVCEKLSRVLDSV